MSGRPAGRRMASAAGLASMAARVPWLRHAMVAAYLRLRPRGRINQRSPFDRELGIDTSGFLPAFLLPSGAAEDAHASPYLGCVPGTLRRVLALVPDPQLWAFVDLGCGKGRALAVASAFGFRRLLGLELSPDLVRVARANARAIARRHPARTPIEIERADASRPVIAGPTVLMIYHSFGATLIERLLDTVEAAGDRGIPVLLIYMNPVHGALADARSGLWRWFAGTLIHHPAERDWALGEGETVVAWQAGQPRLPPLPGSDRPIVVTMEGWSAALG